MILHLEWPSLRRETVVYILNRAVPKITFWHSFFFLVSEVRLTRHYGAYNITFSINVLHSFRESAVAPCFNFVCPSVRVELVVAILQYTPIRPRTRWTLYRVLPALLAEGKNGRFRTALARLRTTPTPELGVAPNFPRVSRDVGRIFTPSLKPAATSFQVMRDLSWNFRFCAKIPLFSNPLTFCNVFKF